jgi:hypothetical protein
MGKRKGSNEWTMVRRKGRGEGSKEKGEGIKEG